VAAEESQEDYACIECILQIGEGYNYGYGAENVIHENNSEKWSAYNQIN